MRPEDAMEELIAAANAVLVPGKPLSTSDLRTAFAAVIPIIEGRERDACAKVIEEYPSAIERLGCGVVPSVIEVACSTIAAAIRARGET